jgi:hypothetical protein
MKKSDLKPGTKVLACVPSEEWSSETIVKYFHNDWNECTLIGVVMDKPAKTGKVWVDWEDCDHRSEGSPEEVKMDILTLFAELPEIEKEYKEACKLIKENMKEAAALIAKSNKLALAAHAQSLEDMYNAVKPLVNAMDNAGWRSSAWGC